MLGLHVICSLFQDLNLQGSLTSTGHFAPKFKAITQVSFMLTVCSEGICSIVQIIVHGIVGPSVSIVKLDIPPILVEIVIIRNREQNGNCFADPWNIEGHDSNDSSR